MEKSSSIKKIRVLRIKELMKREGIRQIDLADSLNPSMEPQNLSRCLRNMSVSERTCERIHEAYPEYRLEWLLGYDSSMTDQEWADRKQREKDQRADSMWSIFEKSLNKKGLSLKFIHRSNEHPDSSERLHADCWYSIVDKSGAEVKRLTALEMVTEEQKLQSYCDYLCYDLLK